MPFSPKNWQDAPATATPLSAVAIEDMEERVTDYTDVEVAELAEHASGWQNVRSYGALGNGTADDTGAFEDARDAAGEGGLIWVPPGTYRLNNFAPTHNQTIMGVGDQTILKAATAAPRVIDINGKKEITLIGFRVEGNSQLSDGVRMISDEVSAVWGCVLEHIHIQQCDNGLDIEPGPAYTQCSKNTYIQIGIFQCNWAIRCQSSNAQEQEFIGGTFSDCDVGLVAFGGGAMGFFGADFLNAPDAFVFTQDAGPQNMQWLRLDRCIFEVDFTSNIRCDSANTWPQMGVIAEQTVFDASVWALDIDAGGWTMLRACTVNNADIRLQGNDHILYTEHTTYGGAATGVVTDIGVNNQHRNRSAGGYGDVVTAGEIFRPVVTGFTPLTIDGKSGQTAPLTQYKVNTVVKSQVNSAGAFVSDDSGQGIVLKDAQGTPHYWRVTVNTSGVLVTADLGTTRPQ